MPEVYFKDDYKNEEGEVIFPKGAFRTFFPGSQIMSDVIESGAAETMDYLPFHFPGIRYLLEAGIDSYQKLKGADLLSIKGIGEKTAKEIEETLQLQTK